MILLSTLKAIWQAVSDWVTGVDTTSKPKVTVDSSALPAGASTGAKQDTGNASLATIAAKDSSTAANQTTINTNITAVNTAIGARADTAATTDTGTFSLIALIKRGLQSLTALAAKIPALGAAAKAASIPVNIASDQTVPVQLMGSYLKLNNYGTFTLAAGETATLFEKDFSTTLLTKEWRLAGYLGGVAFTDATWYVDYTTVTADYGSTRILITKSFPSTDIYVDAGSTGGWEIAQKMQCLPIGRYMRIRVKNNHGSMSMTLRNVSLIEEQPKGVSA